MTKRRVYPTYFLAADPTIPYPRLTDREPCRTDPERWFEEVPGAGILCQGCPVLTQCARWALANPQLTAYGVWGGMTSRQRANIRRRRNRKRQEQEVAA